MSRVGRGLAVLALTASALLTVTPRAFAVTISEIVQLTKAGVSEPVILALIDRDRTLFGLDAAQIVTLKEQGISDTVLIAMLKSGIAEADASVREQSDRNAAAILASLTTVPELVVVGHGPEIPNGPTHYAPTFYDYPGVITVPAMPYVSSYLPPALVVQSAPCASRTSFSPGAAAPRWSSCSPPLRRGRPIR